MFPKEKVDGFFRIHQRDSLPCPGQYDHRHRYCAGPPLIHVSKAETVFRHSLLRSLDGSIVLYDCDHGRFGLGSEEKTHWPRGRTVR